MGSGWLGERQLVERQLARSCRYERKSGGQRENERKWKMLPWWTQRTMDNRSDGLGCYCYCYCQKGDGQCERAKAKARGVVCWAADENLKYIPTNTHTLAHWQEARVYCHKATTLNFRSSKIYAKDADVPANAKKNVRLCACIACVCVFAYPCGQ